MKYQVPAARAGSECESISKRGLARVSACEGWGAPAPSHHGVLMFTESLQCRSIDAAYGTSHEHVELGGRALEERREVD